MGRRRDRKRASFRRRGRGSPTCGRSRRAEPCTIRFLFARWSEPQAACITARGRYTAVRVLFGSYGKSTGLLAAPRSSAKDTTMPRRFATLLAILVVPGVLALSPDVAPGQKTSAQQGRDDVATCAKIEG